MLSLQELLKSAANAMLLDNKAVRDNLYKLHGSETFDVNQANDPSIAFIAVLEAVHNVCEKYIGEDC